MTSFPLTTTLAKVREAGGVRSETFPVMMRILAAHYADDEPFPYEAIIDLFSPTLALNCLMKSPEHKIYWREFTLWCARQARPFIKDKRSLMAITVGERFHNGEASEEEVAAAYILASEALKDRLSSESASEHSAKLFARLGCCKEAIWDFGACGFDGLTESTQINALRTLVTVGSIS